VWGNGKVKQEVCVSLSYWESEARGVWGTGKIKQEKCEELVK